MGVGRAEVLLFSIVIEFLTKVGWCLVLFTNVMVRLMFLAMHALWLPCYVSAWFRGLFVSCCVSILLWPNCWFPRFILLCPNQYRVNCSESVSFVAECWTFPFRSLREFAVHCFLFVTVFYTAQFLFPTFCLTLPNSVRDEKFGNGAVRSRAVYVLT